jgi:hypothetical protein
MNTLGAQPKPCRNGGEISLVHKILIPVWLFCHKEVEATMPIKV